MQMIRETKSLKAVRERESYTLTKKSAVLFDSLTHTHTSNLIEERKAFLCSICDICER